LAKEREYSTNQLKRRSMNAVPELSPTDLTIPICAIFWVTLASIPHSSISSIAAHRGRSWRI